MNSSKWHPIDKKKFNMYEEKMRSDGKISTILTYTMKSFYTKSNLNLTDMNCDIEKTIQIKNAK